MTSMKTKLRRKQGRKSTGPPFVQLYKYMLRCPAWLALSATAKAAYVQLALRYDGVNNGMLALSARVLAEELGCTKDTASRKLIELEDAGFIEAVRIGRFARRNRKASEYRLTTHRCDVTGVFPSKNFMVPAGGLHSRKTHPSRSDRKDRTVRLEGQLGPNSSPRSDRKDRKANSTPAHGPIRGTLIDSHHVGVAPGVVPSLPWDEPKAGEPTADPNCAVCRPDLITIRRNGQ
jgi:hypothetical protein